jgi:hypothetical protein
MNSNTSPIEQPLDVDAVDAYVDMMNAYQPDLDQATLRACGEYAFRTWYSTEDAKRVAGVEAMLLALACQTHADRLSGVSAQVDEHGWAHLNDCLQLIERAHYYFRSRTTKSKKASRK